MNESSSNRTSQSKFRSPSIGIMLLFLLDVVVVVLFRLGEIRPGSAVLQSV